MHDVFHVS
jgi:hypothetical protein